MEKETSLPDDTLVSTATALPESPLLIGEANFPKLLTTKSVYVDKTALIYTLVTDPVGRFFLARPRRFGKSLLVSTIENVLRGKKELFKNLDICKKFPAYHWDSSYVIRLDMNRFAVEEDVKDFDKSVLNKIVSIAKGYGIELIETTTAGTALCSLVETLHSAGENSKNLLNNNNGNILNTSKVSVLIDEYDYPIVSNLKKPDKLEKIIDKLNEFYNNLKSVFDLLHFVLITGITRFSILSPFSSIHFANISYDTNFATICGFTQDEIEAAFKNYLLNYTNDKIHDVRKLSFAGISEILLQLSDWYGGYSFDGKTKVFNPESILKYFKNNVFKKYWYVNGGSRIFNYLKLQNLDYFKYFSDKVDSSITISEEDIVEVTPEASLLQTGYLTVERIIPALANKIDLPVNTIDMEKANVQIDNQTNTPIVSQLPKMDTKTYYVLKVPNLEVKLSYDNLFLLNKLYGQLPSTLSMNNIVELYKDFGVVFPARDTDKASLILSSIYETFPHVLHIDRESFYETHLIPALSFADGIVVPEYSSAHGIVDIYLKMFNGDVFVIEVKFSPANIAKDEGKDDNRNRFIGSYESSDTYEEIRTKSSAITKDQIIDLNIKKALDNGITEAFNQIFSKRYALKHIGKGNNVYATAVSVSNRSYVKIQMMQVQAIRGIDSLQLKKD
ncbi:MAG: AAA family ATPase [Deltaproteobacteria bacterium]|jgi:hypothetical protein|nr:AAA family ATPase [Deltaproteobacteria bacterium]